MDIVKELEERFHRDIPLTWHMGLSVETYDEQGLTLRAPLDKNINHKQTAFGGSLNCLVTLAGWGMVYILLKEMEIDAHIIIQESKISYLKPVTDDFQAICPKPDDAMLQKFQKMLQKKGLGRIPLHCVIYEEETLAVEFRGSYVASVIP
ncbi:MAG: thioesterase domain-containing protein [SAR324 cluster bacterium]|nr:thioesterase domain-containing protein [SAR324 cluster bacterium]